MFQATLYKEWIKLRLYWALLFAANLGFAAYLSLRLRAVHEFNTAATIWGAWIFKGYLFFNAYHYAPLVTGLLLGALQFLPEIFSKRIRLVLHLPIGEERVVAQHLFAGLLLLTFILAPVAALLAFTGGIYFPAEFQRNLWLTLSPWLLAGYAGYLLAATLLLETTWRYRIFYLLLGGAALRLFFLGDFYDTYLRVLSGFALWTVILFSLPLFSSYRFCKGL